MIRVRFKNKKSGDIYILCGYVTNQTNGFEDQEMCQYFREDDKNVPLKMYVRNCEEFLEKFTHIKE